MTQDHFKHCDFFAGIVLNVRMQHFAPTSHAFICSLWGGVNKQLVSFNTRQLRWRQLPSSKCKSSACTNPGESGARRRAAGSSKTQTLFDLRLTCWWIREGSELRKPLGGAGSGLNTSQVEVLPVEKQDGYLSVNFTPVSFCNIPLVHVGSDAIILFFFF